MPPFALKLSCSSILGLHLTSWRPCRCKEQKRKRLLGIWLYYYAKTERHFAFVLYNNMAVKSRECKPKIQCWGCVTICCNIVGGGRKRTTFISRWGWVTVAVWQVWQRLKLLQITCAKRRDYHNSLLSRPIHRHSQVPSHTASSYLRIGHYHNCALRLRISLKKEKRQMRRLPIHVVRRAYTV